MNQQLLCRVLLAVLLASCSSPREDASPQWEEEERQKLRSLGYLNVVPVTSENRGKVGVTQYVPGSSYEGFNLFNSRNQNLARLMSMEGQPLHVWTSEVKGKTLRRAVELLPSGGPAYLHGWNHIEMLDDGDLFVIGSHHMLLRLDWQSNLKWKLDIAAHHDLSVADDGRIHVLVDRVRAIDLDGEPIGFQDNEVVVLSPDGEFERRISLFDALNNEPWREELKGRLRAVRRAREETFESVRAELEGGKGSDELLRLFERATRGEVVDGDGVLNILFHNRATDIFHSNSIQVLDRSQPGFWKEGDLLLCVLRFDMIVVIDQDTGRVLWTWGSEDLEAPHHATHLADGSVLVFDNGSRRGYSRIVKVEPVSREIVWEYVGEPPESFYSSSRGGCQELPNGNVLITETNTGRVFEITSGGEIVWEYYNEVLERRAGKKKRGAIYRMTRLPVSAVDEVLRSTPATGLER